MFLSTAGTGSRTAYAFVFALAFALAPGLATAAPDRAKGSLSLQIQGRAETPAGPLVGATVTAFGGVTSPTATTDASGNFTVTISFPSAASLGRLSVRGTGAQSHVELTSVPGSYTTMLAAAGDATLDRSEDPYVDLTPHTTAVYLAMRAIDPLVDEAGWQRAVRSFSSQDAFDRTVTVAATADGIVPLPAGVATTLEGAATLASAQAIEDLLFDPDTFDCRTPAICTFVAQLRTPANLPVLATPVMDQEFRAFSPFNARVGELRALTLSTGGTGFAVTMQQRAPIVWALIGDYLRVHRGDDSGMTSSEFFSTRACGGATPIRTVFETVAYRVRQVAGPGGGMLLQVGQELRTSFPDTPACTATTQTSDPSLYWRAVRSTDAPLQIADPTGKTIVLPVCASDCAGPPAGQTGFDNTVAEPHRFDAAGVGQQLRLGRTFTWTLDFGRLNLTYSNGHSANVTQVSDEFPDGNGGAVTRYVDTSGIHLLATSVFAVKDPAAQFGPDLEAAAATWDSKINKEWPFGSVPAQFRVPFGFIFTADGTGTRIGGFGFHRWQLDAPDRITHDQFANSTSTTVQRRRFWELIRADDDQYLILESFFTAGPFPATAAPTDRLFVYVRNGNASAASAPDAPIPLATPGDAGDAAGTAVASGGGFVVIGAPNAAVDGVNSGAVYVYRTPTGPAPVAGKHGLAHYALKDLDLVATLEPTSPTIGDKWGAAVTIAPDGNSIAIGAPEAGGAGLVAVFDKPVAGWSDGLVPDDVLAPPSLAGVVVEDFGASLAMTAGGTLAVGAPGTEVDATAGAGMVSVYTPDGTGFDAPQQIMPTVEQSGAGFGAALAASDELLAIGAPNQDDADGDRDSGAVYTYTAPAPDSSFTFSTALASPDLGTIGNKFGAAVGVEGSTLVVGEPFADTTRGPDSGSAYLYEGTGGVVSATPTTQLIPQGVEGDGSGASVAIIDGVVVLGAPFATRDGLLASGAAFVFRRDGENWSDGDAQLLSERELGPDATQANQQFGASLTLTRDLLVTGSPNRDRASAADQGDADAFALDRIFAATFE